MHDVLRDLAIWIASDLGIKKGKYLTVQPQKKLQLHEWEKAEKISLVGNISIGELNGAPNCLNLSTLLLHHSNVNTISDDFFRSMPMLKVLDMSGLRIKKLPPSIFSLRELRYLDLSSRFQRFGRYFLSSGIFVSFTKLKMLDLYCSGLCNWEVEGGPSLSELESLKDLNYLGISLETGLAVQRLVSSHRLQMCTKLLSIFKCHGIKTLVLSPPFLPLSPAVSSLVSLANMVSLKTLRLDGLNDLEELRMEDKDTLFTNLEKLKIWSMQKLKIVWYVPQRSTEFCFVNLKDLRMGFCPKLKDITWLMYAQNLELLQLTNLKELEEVISGDKKLTNTFSRLKSVSFISMPSLKKICNPNVKFLSLERIVVYNSRELKKLPFNINSVVPSTLQLIQGHKDWWELLEWEDQTIKSLLAPYISNSQIKV